MNNPRLTILISLLRANAFRLALATRRYDAVNDVTEARTRMRAWWCQ
jgi:hypothetical protein